VIDPASADRRRLRLPARRAPRRRPVRRAWIASGITTILLVAAGIIATSLVDFPRGNAAEATNAPYTPTPGATATTGPDAQDPPSTAGPGASVEANASARAALDLLDALPVKGKAPQTGYNRTEKFGSAWLDVDDNGCDTRNDILARDLTEIVRWDGCTVLSGTLADPYTGTTLEFVRGTDTSTLVHIDHVVSLSNSWQTGAQQLTQEQRVAFANDPLNLFAADGRANLQKGDGDAATWLPPAKSFRCDYVGRQIAVKAAYTLWVTKAEHEAMERVLGDCVR
jgi:hypothetical protein